MSSVDELERLARLHKAGTLSDSEYETAKKQALSASTSDASHDRESDAKKLASKPGSRKHAATLALVVVAIIVVLAGLLVGNNCLAVETAAARQPSQAVTCRVSRRVRMSVHTIPSNELEFAQTSHDCGELTAWYEHNPGDSNLDNARQYLDRVRSDAAASAFL